MYICVVKDRDKYDSFNRVETLIRNFKTALQLFLRNFKFLILIKMSKYVY